MDANRLYQLYDLKVMGIESGDTGARIFLVVSHVGEGISVGGRPRRSNKSRV